MKLRVASGMKFFYDSLLDYFQGRGEPFMIVEPKYVTVEGKVMVLLAVTVSGFLMMKYADVSVFASSPAKRSPPTLRHLSCQ